jgi:ppGpp synthetase/RelA/SpoT-type nucleotidyltranferase
MSESMVREYEDRREALVAIGERVEAQLRGLLGRAGVPVQFVTWRLKSSASLGRKLARPEKTYRQLWDVTDLVALRVATYFEDHVEQVARLIEQHFHVDFTHSADKTKPEGYRSVHYVCTTSEAPHPDFRFEIQLRTVLQHAWAEVEHDLGYKVDDAVPEAIRRRFSRVAGLLEIADQEFVSIRRELASSRNEAQATLAKSGALPLDLVSLDALIRQSAIEALDREVAQALSAGFSDEAFFPDYLVKVLRLAGLETTKDVAGAVAQHGAEVKGTLGRYFDFARRSLGFAPESIERVQRGYSLLFVALLSVIRADALAINKVARLARLYLETDFAGDERRAQRVAGELMGALS